MRALLLLLLLTVTLNGAAGQVPLVLAERDRGPGHLRLEISGAQAEDLTVEGGELLVRFASPIALTGLDRLLEATAAWIVTIEYGYDSLLIGFARDTEVSGRIEGPAVIVDVRRASAEPAQVPATGDGGATGPDPQQVRLGYYRALAMIESGAVQEGRAALVDLMRQDPRNIEVILLLSQAEERLNRRLRSLVLYDRALELDPELPFAIRDRHRVRRELADEIMVSSRYQDVENGETQIISTAEVSLVSATGLSAAVNAESRHVDTGSLNRTSGFSGPFEGDRQRGEIRLDLLPGELGALSASLYASNTALGAGGQLVFDDGFEVWQFDGRWSEPDFTYVEGIVDGGARDRLAAGWRRRVDDVFSLSAGVSANRYTMDGDHAGAGLGLTLGARRTLAAPWPFVSLGYTLDSEYIANTQISDASGLELLPLKSRAAQTVDLSAEGYLADYLRARGFVGVSYDHLNGGGPLGEFSLIYTPLVDLEITATVGSGLTASRGTDSQLVYGGISLRTRF